MTFARFMEIVLYHPQAGYYIRNRRRTGRSGADFLTASSLGTLFGESVAAAACALVAPDDPRELTFVEIGAEPGAPALSPAAASPFDACRTIGVTGPLQIPFRSIVFSNELFDAQTFHRVVRREGSWREIGVAIGDGGLAEVELARLSEPVARRVEDLPAAAPDGYRIDLPLGSVDLLRRITGQRWNGLFLAFDYGRSWKELCTEYPDGTARAYSAHRQGRDLLANPGDQDLTCHVCWDWLADGLRESGFRDIRLESQEAFFTRRASEFLAATLAAEASRFSPRKQELMQLLHPAHMGQKFQVLSALRK